MTGNPEEQHEPQGNDTAQFMVKVIMIWCCYLAGLQYHDSATAEECFIKSVEKGHLCSKSMQIPQKELGITPVSEKTDRKLIGNYFDILIF